ncbi:MAG: tetratricopeptide repeat protein [Methanoregula sp.]
MKKIFFMVPIFFLILITCGCLALSPSHNDTNISEFAENVNASRIYYDTLVQSDPNNSTAWVIRGMYYNNAFNQYEEALRSYNRSLELDPDNGLAWYAKGTTLQNMHRYNESGICFENARKFGIK